MPFTFEPQAIPEVVLVTPKIFGDNRGFFLESFKASEWKAAGLGCQFVQENHSRSCRGTVRGLHFQLPPHGQAKLVRAMVGEIFDVAVDMRRYSPTFGKWVGVTLSAENRAMLYIPEWCAHGFAVLSETADVLYKTSSEYAPPYEHGVMWNDPQIAIEWPISRAEALSDRDSKWPPFEVAAAQLNNNFEMPLREAAGL
jgi:dTDP-4-dehydrorhamnose 3,5-epimerase